MITEVGKENTQLPQTVEQLAAQSAIPQEQLDRAMKMAAAEQDAKDRQRRAQDLVQSALNDNRCTIVTFETTECAIGGSPQTRMDIQIRPLP